MSLLWYIFIVTHLIKEVVMSEKISKGDRFGHLVYTGETNGETGNLKRHHFICDCGKDTWVRLSKVLSGSTKSCGCLPTRQTRFDVSRLLPYIDEDFPEDRCLIESGNFKMDYRIHACCRICHSKLSYRAIKHFFFRTDHFCMCRSCTMKEVSKGGTKGVVVNPDNKGLKKDNPRLYNIWKNMMSRCYKETSNVYSLYGGRGVIVCDDWKRAKEFFEWAFSSGYSDDLTIDRIDTNGNYEPTNCRWVSVEEQNRNKRCTRYINSTDSKTFFDSSEHDPSVTYLRFFMRYFKSGWSLEDSLNIPNEGRRGKTYKMISKKDVNSQFQRDVRDYIKSLSETNIWYNVDLGGFVVSLAIPDKKIAFNIAGKDESQKLDKKYYFKSFETSLSVGYRLITIFECDWVSKKEACKRIILESLKKPNKRIYARDLEVQRVTSSESEKFFSENHFDGFGKGASIHYALRDKSGIYISMMSFGGLRGQNLNHIDKTCFELYRFATLFDVQVVGGASKLISAFIKENKPSQILSYSDNDFFSGNMYKALGFEKLDCGRVLDYVWFDGNFTIKRYSTMPKKLEKLYPHLCAEACNAGVSVEDYVMEKRGFCKIYRCGNSRWILNPIHK